MLCDWFLTTELSDLLMRLQTKLTDDICFLAVSSLLVALDEQRGIQTKCNHFEQLCSALELRSLLISLFSHVAINSNFR